ncbi:Nn.00g034370.m01.CDS01 [Neocucurbitaria sp. VM-36]
MVKRTYSQRDKRRSGYGHQGFSSHNDNRKRPRIDNLDELRLPPTPPPSRGEKSSSLLQKSLKVFDGPISIPEDDLNAKSTPKSTSRLPVFDKVLNEPRQAAITKQPNIYGSREDFAETMKSGKQWKQHDSKPSKSYLPTPPAEVQKKTPHEACRAQKSTKSDLAAVKHVPNVPNGFSMTETPGFLEMAVTKKRLKQHHESETYKANKTTTPLKILRGDRLPKNSRQAQMWSTNQSRSKFLQLPGEVRNMIYEYVVGGNTIHINFETYRTILEPDVPGEPGEPDVPVVPRLVIPIFKYHYTIYDQRANPFEQTEPPDVRISTGLTLLSDICRQMYLETAVMPFNLSLISFDSHNTMFNFLFKEQRISRAQLDAITELALPFTLPEPNMLIHLRNLEKVLVGIDQGQGHLKQGWYRVIRDEDKEPKLVAT